MGTYNKGQRRYLERYPDWFWKCCKVSTFERKTVWILCFIWGFPDNFEHFVSPLSFSVCTGSRRRTLWDLRFRRICKIGRWLLKLYTNKEFHMCKETLGDGVDWERVNLEWNCVTKCCWRWIKWNLVVWTLIKKIDKLVKYVYGCREDVNHLLRHCSVAYSLWCTIWDMFAVGHIIPKTIR